MKNRIVKKVLRIIFLVLVGAAVLLIATIVYLFRHKKDVRKV